MLDVYADFAETFMAMPVIRGEKSPTERFPGAVSTWAIEAMMQDGKALQAGTSHFLGQNFAKSSEIKYLDAQGVLQFAWTTSWGVSTRLIGGLLMTHSDDDGLIVPPRLAPAHVVILPITTKAERPEAVIAYCKELRDQLTAKRYHERGIEVELDERDLRGGEKNWSWVKKGIPIRLEVGPRDMAQDSVFMARRDLGTGDKQSLTRAAFIDGLPSLLDSMQQNLHTRAQEYRERRTREIDSQEELYAYFGNAEDSAPSEAGFALTHWSGDPAVEVKLKQDLGVTLRCIPLEPSAPGTCPFTGQPSKQRVVWAKAY
jgi:prolyl-tRNA synthetase